MKRIFLLIFSAGAAITASAQDVRINLYGAYVFDDGYDVFYDANTYYNGKIKGGFQWGGGIEYLPNPMYGIELLYQHQGTDAPTNFKTGLTEPQRTENFSVGLDYILLGGNFYKPVSSKKVEGYGGLMAGVLLSNVESPSTGNSGSNTTFAWGGKFGANIWASDKIGIKLQAQLLSASKATGGELYFSYWGPLVLETYTTLWQFGLGGGLTFKLGK